MSQPIDTLGASDSLLSYEEKVSLDRLGYASLGKLLSDDENFMLFATASNQYLQTRAIKRAMSCFHPNESSTQKKQEQIDWQILANKGEVFDILYTHPKLLSAIRHVLGDEFKLSSLNYRSAKPGQGLQKLHADWPDAVEPEQYKVCNSIWLLDDFTAANGATRVVPGTHLCGKTPEESMDDPWKQHPDETLIEAKAGTVVVFNSHCWHGGTTNQTDHPRRAIHSYFCGRDQIQQTPQKDWIRQETLDRIPEEARWLLDV